MKIKLLIVLGAFLLTGCFGNASKGNLTESCQKNDKGNDFESNLVYNIKFKDSIVNNIEIIDEYKANNENGSNSITAIKEAIINRDSLVKNYKGLVIETDKNEKSLYRVIYKIDMNEYEKEHYDLFGLDKNFNQLIKKLQAKNMTCK